MGMLRLVSLLTAAALAIGEIARWWGQARFFPLAFDELLVAAALIVAAWATPRAGAVPLVAAWGAYCGLIIGLVVPTLDHLLFGPAKESAGFYAAVLGAMLALGLWGVGRALSLALAPSRAP
jgi:hypothetical protein